MWEAELRSRAALAFWSVSVTFIHRVHRFFSAVAPFYQLAFWSVSGTFIHDNHRFYLTDVLLYFTGSDTYEASIQEQCELSSPFLLL